MAKSKHNSYHNLLYRDDPNDAFVKSIISITRVIGNKMNIGYHQKENTVTFNLDILSQLFEIRSLDEAEQLCIFDVVIKSYMNYTNQILSRESFEGIRSKCVEVS